VVLKFTFLAADATAALAYSTNAWSKSTKHMQQCISIVS